MKRLRRVLQTMVVAAVLCGTLAASPVLADPTLTVKGALVESSVEPGRGYKHTFLVVNEGDVPIDVFVEPRGFGQALDGAFQALPAEDDTSPYSGREYVTKIDNTSFLLAPGASQEVTAYFDVPSRPGEGTRYAILYVYSPQIGGQGVGFLPSLDVPVLLTVSTPDTLQMTGGIAELTVDQPLSGGDPFLVTTVGVNTGNHHFKGQNVLTLFSENGTELATASSGVTDSSIVPTFGFAFEQPLSVSGSIPAGNYRVESQFIDEEGVVLDVKSISFEYVPGEAGGQILTMRWFIVGGIVLLVVLVAMLLILVSRRRRATA